MPRRTISRFEPARAILEERIRGLACGICHTPAVGQRTHDDAPMMLPLSFRTVVFAAAVTGSVATALPRASAQPAKDESPPVLRIETGGHTALCRYLQFLPDGRHLLSAGKDKTVRVWDVSNPGEPKLERTFRYEMGSGQLSMIYAGALDPVLLPTGKRVLAIAGLGAIDTEVHWGAIRLIDFESGRSLGLLVGHTNGVVSLDFSANGHWLASGSIDGTIRVWNLTSAFDEDAIDATTTELVDGKAPYTRLNAPCEILRGHSAEVKRVAFLPAASESPASVPPRLVSASDDKALRIWQFGDGGKWSTQAVLEGHTASVLAIACSPDGMHIASAGDEGSERLWDARDGKFLREIGKHGHGSSSLLFTPDSERIVSAAGCGNDHTVASYVYRVADGQRLALFLGHNNHVASAAISPDGTLVASSGSNNEEILLWDPRNGDFRGRIAGTGNGVFSVALAADASRVAFGTRNNALPLTASATLAQAFHLTEMRPDKFADPDGPVAAGKVPISDTSAAWQRAHLTWKGYSAVREPKHVLTIQHPHAEAADGGETPPAGRIARRQQHDTIHCYGFVPVESPDANDQLVAVGSEYGLSLNKVTGEPVRRFTGHQGIVWSLAVSRDRRYLVSGSADQTFRIWSLQNLPAPRMMLGLYPQEENGKVVADGVEDDMPAAKAGIRNGDVLRAINDRPITKAGQIRQIVETLPSGAHAKLKVLRDGTEFEFSIQPQAKLIADDVEPLLSVFVGSDGEWVAWTPQGYYKASPEGDKLIGWHVNRGLDRPADFYAAWQFKRRFHRPDVVERVLEMGDVAKAFEAAEDERVRLLSRAQRQQLLDIQQEMPQLAPSRVTLLEPRNGQAVRSERVLVRARVAISGSAKNPELHVRLNDRPVEGGVRRGIVPAEGPATAVGTARSIDDAPGQLVEMEVALPLAGQHKLEVFARTDDSTSQPVTIFLSRLADDTTAVKGDLNVLAIGVSNYKNAEWNLGFAASDAAGVADAFRQQSGSLYGNVNVEVLMNEQATRTAVTAALRKLALKANKPQDTVFVLLAGHGVRDPLNDYFFATHEIDREAIDDTAVAWTDLVRILTKMQCRVILALDTCHSGDLAGGWRFDPALGREISDLTDVEGGVVVLTSSKGSEFSLERSDWQHGAFSLALIEALTSRRKYNQSTRTILPADYDNDGVTLLTELQTYLVGRVHELTSRTQNPTVRHSGTPFPISWVK